MHVHAVPPQSQYVTQNTETISQSYANSAHADVSKSGPPVDPTPHDNPELGGSVDFNR
jgi:hypothetical protein